jgi:uncharacterized protein (TIGR03546 family)
VPIKAPDPQTGLLGLDLTWLLGLAVLIVVRCSFHAATVGFVLFGLLGIAILDPLCFSFGKVLLEELVPHGLIQTLYASPALALLQLHTYWVAGSVILGLALGLLVFFLSAWLIGRYREPVRQRMERSRLLRTLNRFWPLRFLRWLLVGGVSLGRG